jgi:hypothetical protein
MPRAEKLFSTRQKTRGENGGGAVVVEKNWRNRSIFFCVYNTSLSFPIMLARGTTSFKLSLPNKNS